jgi:hypothetical protein
VSLDVSHHLHEQDELNEKQVGDLASLTFDPFKRSLQFTYEVTRHSSSLSTSLVTMLQFKIQLSSGDESNLEVMSAR